MSNEKNEYGNAIIEGVILLRCCKEMKVMDFRSFGHLECFSCNTRSFGGSPKQRAECWNKLIGIKNETKGA